MTYYTTRDIKSTRKNHICGGCNRLIPEGSAAFYWAGDCDGDFFHTHYHTDCRALEVEWNEILDNRGDEWADLRTLWDDREPEDDIWLKVEWSVPYARLKGVAL